MKKLYLLLLLDVLTSGIFWLIVFVNVLSKIV